jgi:DNA-binding LacI/PurR family transcriptional regulator
LFDPFVRQTVLKDRERSVPMPTMAEVAERAGVSKSTVSLVLNDKPRVSPELRQAVLSAASELGYRLPSRRSQRRSANKSVIVVHYERFRSDPLATSILADYVSGIQEFVRDRGINLTFITDHRQEDEQLEYHLLSSGHLIADGAILMGWSARRAGALLRLFLDKGVPVVVLSRNWPDLPISTVGQDHRQQACIAVDHLIALGHRQIAFLAAEADRRHEWFQWRLDCYEEKMRQLHGQVDEELIAVGEDCATTAQRLLSRRGDVSAIFAITDPNAVAAIRGLQQIGLGVPEDVSVIGLDGVLGPANGSPALTTVAWPHLEAGRLAAELLLKQIENPCLYYSNIVLHSELVEGASCVPARSWG